jgi:M6 family metalloprotease-like protein
VAAATPQQLEILRRRAQRWRSFPGVVSAPSVDWSARIARRADWRPPAWRVREPRAAMSGLASPGGPPDTFRVALIRIDFLTDRGGSNSTGNGRFDLSGPDSTVPPIDPPPHNRTFFARHAEALGRYFGAQSYGRTVMIGEVWPRTENDAYHFTDMADLGPWEFSQHVYPQAVHMFRSFFFAADTQSAQLGDRIPWHSYDRFIFIHAGSDLQSDVKQDSPEDIPTFTVGVADTDRVVFRDSTLCDPYADPSDPLAKYCPIDRASFIPESATQDGDYGAINCLLAHEGGINLFGWNDVYNIENGYPVVGFWCIMDSGTNVGAQVLLQDGSVLFATGLLPPSADPFMRQFCTDALSFPEATEGDTIALANSERNPDVRRVTLSSDEYLLLENRYVAPVDSVVLDQDSTTHVVMGPKQPDSLEYDALLPGGGILAWHIDESVIPFVTSLRVNPDYGINTNPDRLGISLIQADGLADIGDPGSPNFLGSPTNPWFITNNPTLSDTTFPKLALNTPTRPHRRLDFLDDPAAVMHLTSRRAWQRAGWPVAADFPPGGPQLLAVDADGDGRLDVCWAGGADQVVINGSVVPNPDANALFALRPDGRGIDTTAGTAAFAHLDVRPSPVLAALPTGATGATGRTAGPSLFAVSTQGVGADTTAPGGRVWLLDWHGTPQPGWPARLPVRVTTPPVIAGPYPNALVIVGGADGKIYAMDLTGAVRYVSPTGLAGGVSGRLAVTGTTGPGAFDLRVAASGANGDVGVFHACSSCPVPASSAGRGRPETGMQRAASASDWVQRVGGSGFAADFLWLNFDGTAPRPQNPTCGGDGPQLVAHQAGTLWAFCPAGEALWTASGGDTMVEALGAGDPDGDGYPKVLTQTRRSALAFWNVTGHPSPGWPKLGTRESIPSYGPPLAVDVDGDGRTEVLGLNGSGILAAYRGDATTPAGWPLATGSGCAGAAVAADLDGTGGVDLVAPDRFGALYAYHLPNGNVNRLASPWTMVGGDPGRSGELPASRTATAPPPLPGPLVEGSFKVYPNPARRHPVSLSYQLTQPAAVDLAFFDTSGHQVAEFKRDGLQGDNVVEWDPGHLPAGLYLSRVRFRGASSETDEHIWIGVLR